MNWKFWQRRETREGAYTDALTELLRQQADSTDSAARTAVREGCAGLWARAFASAEVSGARAAALTPSVLALAGRELHDRGEAVFEIVIDGGRVQLQTVSDWYVQGARSWRYRLTITNPTSIVSRWRPADAVVHLRYDPPAEASWTALGPAARARTTEDLAKNTEQRLADELGGPVGHVIPVPDVTGAQGLQADINALKGNSVLVPSTSGGWDVQGGVQGKINDWEPRRLGAHPPEVLAAIRQGAGDGVAISAGVPPVLFRSDADGTAMREAWRQFLHSTIGPIALIVQQELREKLEDPDLALSFDRLFASDLQGRARAFQSMVGGGLDVEKAAALSGLMEMDG